MLNRICNYIEKVFRLIRHIFLNARWVNKGGKVYFGKNDLVRGNVRFGKNVRLCDNVEVRTSKTSISIGNNVTINRNTLVIGKIKIGNDVMIAPNCVIVGSNHVFSRTDIPMCAHDISSKGIVIEDDVWIGANCTVLDGVKISKGCVVGGGSVVTKSIPPYSIAVGNPAKVIKGRCNQ